MDPAFLAHCGHSIFPDEYRGDLRAARTHLEEKLLLLLQQSGPIDSDSINDSAAVEARAEYHLHHAYLATLTGRLNEAYASLAVIESQLLSHLPPYWGLRYTNHITYVDFVRRYPPCLRFYLESGMPIDTPSLVTVTVDGSGRTSDIARRHQENGTLHLLHGLPVDRARYVLLGGLVFFPVVLRSLIASRHPRHPRVEQAQYTTMATLQDELVQKSQVFVQLRNGAMAMDAHRHARYLERLILELHLGVDSPEREEALRSLEEEYLRGDVEDKAGVAICRMIEADGKISPPFSSPVALNLVPVPCILATGASTLWDPVEVDLSFCGWEEATRLYEDAERLFEEAACPRGQVAVLLRQGACLHARALAGASPDFPHQERIALLESSRSRLQKSLELFDLDESNAQVVKAHLVLLDISSQRTADVRERAAEIGRWSKTARNENIAKFVSVFMMRFAHREWEKYSRYDCALVAYECACLCSKQIDDWMAVFQCLAAQAHLHNEMFNYPAARVLIRECLQHLDMVMNLFNTLISSCRSDELGAADRQQFLTVKFDLMHSFAQVAESVLSRCEELEALQEWEERYHRLLEHDDGFQHMRRFMEGERDDRDGHSHLAPDHTRTVWRAAMDGRRIAEKFRAAIVSYNRTLSEGHLARAEAVLTRFVDEVRSAPPTLAGQQYQILAWYYLGEVKQARDVLDCMSDSALRDGQVDMSKTAKLFSSMDISHHVHQDHYDNAITFTTMAEDWQRAQRILNQILARYPALLSNEQQTESGVGLSNRLAAAGMIAAFNGETELAFRRLFEARHLIELRRRSTTDADARLGSFSMARVSNVFYTLARLCLECKDRDRPVSLLNAYDHGHPPETSWEQHALLFLEEARARSVLDSLQPAKTASTPVAELGESESVYKRRAVRYLQGLRTRTAGQNAELRALEAELKSMNLTQQSTSSMPMVDALVSRPDAEQLIKSVRPGTVVIEAAFSRHGCILFAVTSLGIQAYRQGRTRDVDLRRPVMEIMQIMATMRDASCRTDANKRRIESLLADISGVLLDPFAQIIQRMSHITFSVSQPLTAFPFSTLPFRGRPLFFHAAVSQAPSLTVLWYLTQRKSDDVAATRLGRLHEAETVEDVCALPVSVFTKGRTRRSRPIRDSTHLPMAGIEATTIAHMFGSRPIEASHLTRGDFRHLLCENPLRSSIFHMATHGYVDVHAPLLSSISLGVDSDMDDSHADRNFRVLDFAHIHASRHLKLVVFAACLSGLGKATIGNDVLGFAHLVLGTGCKAYLGALWEVSDFASMVLMTLFYKAVACHIVVPLRTDPGRKSTTRDEQHKTWPMTNVATRSHERTSFAEALRAAQIELYRLGEDGGADRAEDLIDFILDAWDEMVAQGKEPDDFIPGGRALLLAKKELFRHNCCEERAVVDWKNPFYWAPFVLTGNGDCFL